jgi:hypothetical protein
MMRNIYAFLIVTACPLILVACGPEKLTDARAKSLLQEAVTGSGRGSYTINDSEVAKLEKPTYIDYTQGATSQAGVQALRRLIKDGLLVKRVDQLVFSDVSGKYEGSVFGRPMHVTLETKPQSVNISGNFLLDWGSFTGYSTPLNGCEGTISGEMQESSSLQLFLRFNKGYIGCYIPSQANLSLSLNKTGYDLVSLNQQINLHGGSPGHKISVSRFRYVPTAEFEHSMLGGNLTSVGNVQVEEVAQLLLASETIAEGQFRWRVDLSRVGSAITGESERRGNGSVRFARRPDGRWAVATFSLN